MSCVGFPSSSHHQSLPPWDLGPQWPLARGEQNGVGERAQDPKLRLSGDLNPNSLMCICVASVWFPLSVMVSLPLPCLVTLAKLFKPTGPHFPHL